MNANAIFSGEEYAYAPYRSKGVFPTSCRKVVALASRKTREYGNERYSTEVQIEEDDGRIRWVRAREIYASWATYEDELFEYNERKRIQQEEYEAAEEKRKAELELKFEEAAALLKVPRSMLYQFSYDRRHVQVNLEMLREFRKNNG